MLYHFSEEAGIEVFVPRELQSRPGFPAAVWAIDGEHEYSYYFPRDCPRIVCRRGERISEEHRLQFFRDSSADIIITLENDWYSRLSNQILYRYHLHDDGFELFDETAGYYISHQIVHPVQVEKLDHLPERLLQKGIELRFTPNLHPLREAILASDFKDFGIHRFGNAKKRKI